VVEAVHSAHCDAVVERRTVLASTPPISAAVCFEGLAGLPDAITASWPKALVQTCVVLPIRSCVRYASWKDCQGIATTIRLI
jgi:transposase-like protein